MILLFRRVGDKLRALRPMKRFEARQRELSGYTDESACVEAKLSFRLNVAKTVAIILLCLTLIIAVLFGGGIFSYENVYYMFRDISYITDYGDSSPDMLTYSQANNNYDFAVFKGGLAVASDTEIKFFTPSGRATLTEGLGYVDPEIVASSRYALVYDRGRREFSVYNSFVRVFSETLDYGISSADMIDSGDFLVVTRSKTYATLVKVYDGSQRLVAECSRNDYVVSAKLSESGDMLAVLSLDARAGESVSTLTLYKIGSETPVFSYSISGDMPYECGFISNGNVAAVCEGRTTVIDTDGDVVAEYLHPSRLLCSDISRGGLSLVFEGTHADGGSMLTVINGDGRVISDAVAQSAAIRKTVFSDGYVYLLSDSEVFKLNSNGIGTLRASHSEDNAEIIVLGDGRALLCTPAAAYYIDFE